MLQVYQLHLEILELFLGFSVGKLHAITLQHNTGCGQTSNVFTFLVKVYDDFCPANGMKFATIKVTVLTPTDRYFPRYKMCIGTGKW